MGKAKRDKKKAKKAAKIKTTRKVKKKKKKSVDTWKTKKWFIIAAPKAFEGKELGQTIATKPEELIGRAVKSTLRQITGNISHQHVQLRFKVMDVKGQTVNTEVIGNEIQRGYIGRQTRRMKSLVPAIFRVQTKDKKKLQITALAFGRHSMRIGQKKDMRKKMVELITDIAKENSYHKFVQEAVYAKVSATIIKDLKKIYPIQRVELIKVRLLSTPELGVVQEAEKVADIEQELPKEEPEEKPKKKAAPKKAEPKEAEEEAPAEEETTEEETAEE